jgi:hypothetical protein
MTNDAVLFSFGVNIMICATGSRLTLLITAVVFSSMAQVCRAQGSGVREVDETTKIFKDIAKTCIKGHVLECFYKALTLGPSAGIDDERQIRMDAQMASECAAALNKLFPIFRQRALEDAQMVRTLRLEPPALRAEYARLQALPRSPSKTRAVQAYTQRLTRYNLAKQAYPARKAARRTVKSGIEFLVRTLKRTDAGLGAKWEVEMQRLVAEWDAIAKR